MSHGLISSCHLQIFKVTISKISFRIQIIVIMRLRSEPSGVGGERGAGGGGGEDTQLFTLFPFP